MNATELNNLVSAGKIKEAMQELVEFSQKYMLHCDTEILLLSSRFNAVNQEKLRGTISNADSNREVNLITYSLLELIKEITPTDSKLQLKKFDNDLNEVKRLNAEFGESSEIKSRQSRLRTKNDIARKIGERIIRTPELINFIKENPSNGLICGLCRKIQIVPDFGDLDILELVSEMVSGDFAKGNIVQAIAQLVYNNKLSFGDDKRVEKILSAMQKGADEPLEKNVESVRASLEYLLKHT